MGGGKPLGHRGRVTKGITGPLKPPLGSKLFPDDQRVRAAEAVPGIHESLGWVKGKTNIHSTVHRERGVTCPLAAVEGVTTVWMLDTPVCPEFTKHRAPTGCCQEEVKTRSRPPLRSLWVDRKVNLYPSMHACIGEGHGNPLQFSCLENPRDGGAWWAAIYGVSHRVGHN